MFEMAQLTQEMQKFMQKGGINPMKNMLPVALQMPVFMSFFFGLRGMANCPVDSMASGGALWFENLLITDPYYLLPAVTCISTYLQVNGKHYGFLKFTCFDFSAEVRSRGCKIGYHGTKDESCHDRVTNCHVSIHYELRQRSDLLLGLHQHHLPRPGEVLQN